MYYTEEQLKNYSTLFGNSNYLEVEALIDKMPGDSKDKNLYGSMMVDLFFDDITLGFIKYDFSEPIVDMETRSFIQRQVEKRGTNFLRAYVAFLDMDKKACIKYLDAHLSASDDSLNEDEFEYLILTPFKNAFPDFYKDVKQLLQKHNPDKLVLRLCDVLDNYYGETDPERMAIAIYPVIQEFPNSHVANTLLGYAYYLGKRWGNAIACFEKIDEFGSPVVFNPSDFAFFKAWSYSKLKEHTSAAKIYEKALEEYPDMPDALNNLGYELYLLKEYSRAKEIFLRCIKERRDIKYAVNNLVRVYLATGQYKDALDFIANPRNKVAPDLVRRAKKHSPINEPISDKVVYDAEDEDTSETATSDTVVEIIAPKQAAVDSQFSSEKLLEDELTLRISAGIPVFGKKLKIYRRKGEYGRQFIIPIGRLDLLAEDDEGSLYIIELKKDSGYDDPYAQTAAYIDWFEKNKPGVQIFGIICLNSPTERLISKVRNDSRIKLYNYSITYEEVI